METLTANTYKGWGGVIPFSGKDNQRYVTLVQDRTGLWGFPGGKIEDEKIKVAVIREAMEEVDERIFVRQLKPVWEGPSSELNVKAYESHFYVFTTTIPFFEHRQIKNDGAIVKAQSFQVNFFINTILNEWPMRAKDLVLARKLGKEFFLEG